MTKKQIALIGVTGAVAAATVLSFGTAGAANTPGSTLADKIASAFHLNKADVQKVINQNRADHEAQHQQDLQAKLDQDVKEDKITGAQEKLILDKLNELKSQRLDLKDKTPEERRATMQKARTDLEQWAKDNNIDLKYLRPLGHGPGHGFGMRMMGVDDAPTSNQ